MFRFLLQLLIKIWFISADTRYQISAWTGLIWDPFIGLAAFIAMNAFDQVERGQGLPGSDVSSK